MRRKDREITDLEEIINIIRKCDVCRIAFHDHPYPYILPLNFGVERDKEQITLFFHGAGAGKKISLIKENSHVAFEMDCSHQLIEGEAACEYTMEYESICGTGIIEMINEEEKLKALTSIMNTYAKNKKYKFDDTMIRRVTVFKITVTSVTGKRLRVSGA